MNIKKFTASVLSLFIILPTLCSCSVAPAEYTRTSFAFDTYVTFRIFETVGNDTPETICDSAVKLLADLENELSATKEDSDISKLNSLAATGPVKVKAQLYWLIKNCVDFSNLTNGAFDITLGKISNSWGFGSEKAEKPDFEYITSLAAKDNYKNIIFDDSNLSIAFKNNSFKLDLGAIGKGYALDMLNELFVDYGVSSGLIDFGGSILTIGEYYGNNWTVSVSNGTKDGFAGKVTLPAAFYSTSNASNRFVEYDGVKYHHIIDGITAFPADKDIVSCTVIGDSGLISDALSTAFYVMGKNDALAFYDKYPLADFIITDKSGNVYVSKGIEDYFVTENNG